MHRNAPRCTAKHKSASAGKTVKEEHHHSHDHHDGGMNELGGCSVCSFNKACRVAHECAAWDGGVV